LKNATSLKVEEQGGPMESLSAPFALFLFATHVLLVAATIFAQTLICAAILRQKAKWSCC
jgi:hypothetical protein